MKILIVSPWENRWVGYMRDWFTFRGHEVQWTPSPKPLAFLKWADVVLLGWANEHAVGLSKLVKTVPYVCYVRSYELMETPMAKQVDWEKIDAQIFVNPAMQTLAKRMGIPTENSFVLPNAIDLSQWPLQEHGPGKKIAFVADLSFKKGIQLLAQVLLALPKDYELHIAGQVYRNAQRDFGSFQHILRATGAEDRVIMHGKVENLVEWFQDKNYLLCTSQVEGCPNNVLEAMACGIKPIIYNWPGSDQLFGRQLDDGSYHRHDHGHEWIFDTVHEAVNKITSTQSGEVPYDSEGCRKWVEERFTPDIIYTPLESILKSAVAQASQAKEAANV